MRARDKGTLLAMIAICVIFVLFFLVGRAAAEDVLLAEHVTEYKAGGLNKNRANNIELAAAAVDGVVLEPWQEFSYNAIVGRRSPARGYKHARVIDNGTMVDAPGGGVCQVSSTLHAAAFYAGLEVLQARPHSRALAYIRPGLDATVVYGSLDMRFRNNTLAPVRIIAQTIVEGGQGMLRVQLWSSERLLEAKVDLVIHERVTYDVIRYETSILKTGEVHVQEPGTYGYSVTRHRTVTNLASGVVRHEKRHFTYESTPRIEYVGAELETPI